MDAPLIVAAKHLKVGMSDRLIAETKEKLSQELNPLAQDGVKRRLFIEGTREFYSSVLEDPNVCDLEPCISEPYYHAVRIALNAGWQVVTLDKASYEDVIQNYPPKSPERRYMQYNLRERHWALVLRQHSACSNDIMLIHPNHVEGFLAETGFPSERVRWLDTPEVKAEPQRLDPEEIRKLHTDQKTLRAARAERKRLSN